MFDRFFKAAALLNALMFAALVVYTLHGYGGLPDLVAVDFGPAGEPVMGPKTYLATPVVVIVGAAGLVAAFIAFFTLKRHTIVERYPYLINIPAVAMILGRLPRDEARKYIDKLLLPLPLVGAATTALMALTTYVIIESAKEGRLIIMQNLLIAGVLAFAVGVGLGTILYFRRIYTQLRGA